MEKISKVLKKNSRDAYQISEMKSNRINNRFNSAKKEICFGGQPCIAYIEACRKGYKQIPLIKNSCICPYVKCLLVEIVLYLTTSHAQCSIDPWIAALLGMGRIQAEYWSLFFLQAQLSMLHGDYVKEVKLDWRVSVTRSHAFCLLATVMSGTQF